MAETYVNNKKKIYVTPKELLFEYDKSIEIGKPTEKLIVLFEKIAKHFGTVFDYKNKCDFNACVNYAISEAWLKWDKFNPEKSDNLFSFYTTMISNDMRYQYKLINKGKNIQISIDSLFSNSKE
jgi:hypothetical protein